MPLTQYKRLENLYYWVNHACPESEYHNSLHARDITNTIGFICMLESVNSYNTFIAQTAGVIHDLVYECGCNENEKKSIEKAIPILNELGYTQPEIQEVSRLVAATEVGHEPEDLLEEIIQDADRANMGTFDFAVMNECLMREWGIDRKEWYRKSLEILKNIKYRTKTAQELYGPGLKENIEFLESLVEIGEDGESEQRKVDGLMEEMRLLAEYGKKHPIRQP